MTRQELIAVIRTELKRQFDDSDSTLNWYADDDKYPNIDGNVNLESLADAILKADK